LPVPAQQGKNEVSKVDFHIIDNDEKSAFFRYACRLVRKAYNKGHRVYVRTENEQDMKQLDTFLWTFSDLDFIPHAMLDRESGQEPVIIGMIEHQADSSTVLINLSTTMVKNYSSYSRVFEVVSNDPVSVAAGRERYRNYRQMNDELSNHHVAAN
jgi:DNA polymerase-3 subunit chi